MSRMSIYRRQLFPRLKSAHCFRDLFPLISATILMLWSLAPAMAPTHAHAAALASLNIAEPGAPDTLNPLLTRTAAGTDATAAVFDSLVRFDPAGVPRPDLALSWKRSVDARTWTFVLDPRAHWQDAEPVTAADVAFTVRLVRDARFGALSTRGFDDITSFNASGYVITMTLRAAFAPFLTTVGTTPILPSHVLATLSPAAIRTYAAFNHHPIGSGPYTVVSFTPDGRVVEDANPSYFGEAPRLDRLIFTPVASRAAALSAGADGDTVLPPALDLTPLEVLPYTGTAPARAVYGPGFGWTHIDLIEHGALADPRVRQALALATPRDRIIAQVLLGYGRIADGDQAPGTPAYDPTLHNSYHYNLTSARRLLMAAGYLPPPQASLTATAPVSTPISATAPVTTPISATVPFTIDIWADAACAVCAPAMALITQGWHGLGIGTRVHLVPTAILFGPRGPLYDPDRFKISRYDAVLYTWVNGPDPDDSAYWTRAAQVTPAHPLGGNFTGFANAAIDYLATRALVTPNGPGRYSLYRRIQRLLVEGEPDVFLYWADSIAVIPRTLNGYRPNPYSTAATWNAAHWSF